MKKTLLIIILLISYFESFTQNCYDSLTNKELIALIEEDYNKLTNNIIGFDTTNFAFLIEQGLKLWKLGFTEGSLVYFNKFCLENKTYKRESFKDFRKVKYSTLFGENATNAKLLLSDVSYKISLVGHNESLVMKDYDSANSFIKFTLFFTSYKNSECRSHWRHKEVNIAEERYEHDVYKLIKYHWRKLCRDSSRIKNHKFIGFDHMLEKIDNEFTKESYSEFLEKLLEDSFIKSTDQHSSILESRIQNQKVFFYDRDLSCRFSHPNVCCDTITGYFHEEPHPWAETIKIECDTISNSLNPNIDFEQYRNLARGSTLFWIKNQLID